MADSTAAQTATFPGQYPAPADVLILDSVQLLNDPVERTAITRALVEFVCGLGGHATGVAHGSEPRVTLYVSSWGSVPSLRQLGAVFGAMVGLLGRRQNT